MSINLGSGIPKIPHINMTFDDSGKLGCTKDTPIPGKMYHRLITTGDGGSIDITLILKDDRSKDSSIKKFDEWVEKSLHSKKDIKEFMIEAMKSGKGKEKNLYVSFISPGAPPPAAMTKPSASQIEGDEKEKR